MNPHIDWKGVEVEIPVAGKEWKRKAGKKRLAGVSSFGFSGTNAHVVLEEAPEAARGERSGERGVQVLAVSARTESALEELSGKYAESLEGELEDICYTAAAGRAGLAERAVYVGETREELRDQLRQRQALGGGRRGSRDGGGVSVHWSGSAVCGDGARAV